MAITVKAHMRNGKMVKGYIKGSVNARINNRAATSHQSSLLGKSQNGDIKSSLRQLYKDNSNLRKFVGNNWKEAVDIGNARADAHYGKKTAGYMNRTMRKHKKK